MYVGFDGRKKLRLIGSDRGRARKKRRKRETWIEPFERLIHELEQKPKPSYNRVTKKPELGALGFENASKHFTLLVPGTAPHYVPRGRQDPASLRSAGLRGACGATQLELMPLRLSTESKRPQ